MIPRRRVRLRRRAEQALGRSLELCQSIGNPIGESEALARQAALWLA